jgi:hypothetical protein
MPRRNASTVLTLPPPAPTQLTCLRCYCFTLRQDVYNLTADSPSAMLQIKNSQFFLLANGLTSRGQPSRAAPARPEFAITFRGLFFQGHQLSVDVQLSGTNHAPANEEHTQLDKNSSPQRSGRPPRRCPPATPMFGSCKAIASLGSLGVPEWRAAPRVRTGPRRATRDYQGQNWRNPSQLSERRHTGPPRGGPFLLHWHGQAGFTRNPVRALGRRWHPAHRVHRPRSEQQAQGKRWLRPGLSRDYQASVASDRCLSMAGTNHPQMPPSTNLSPSRAGGSGRRTDPAAPQLHLQGRADLIFKDRNATVVLISSAILIAVRLPSYLSNL